VPSPSPRHRRVPVLAAGRQPQRRSRTASATASSPAAGQQPLDAAPGQCRVRSLFSLRRSASPGSSGAGHPFFVAHQLSHDATAARLRQAVERAGVGPAGSPRQRGPRPQRRGPRPRAAPRARPVRGRRHRVHLLGHRDRAPPAAAASPARRDLAHQRAAVRRRTQARARAPPRSPRHLPHTGRARPGHDRARVLLRKYSGGLDLHQLRHSAATHLGEQKVPLRLIMAKTRHKSPRTAMRDVRPGDAAVAEVTQPARRAPAQPLTPAAGTPGPLAAQPLPPAASSASSARTRRAISSRIGRTCPADRPAGPGSCQSG